MFKQLTIAATTLVAIAMTPGVPAVTGTALAQTACRLSCDPPPHTGGGDATTYNCSGQLGFLRRVYEEELDGIDNPNLVSVVPVCMGESYGLMRSDGNAGALRQSIASNGAMEEALFRSNFASDDVVGIRMTGDQSVILYVHPFHGD